MKRKKRTIRMKIPTSVREAMLTDLRRPHAWAFERVGFLYTRSKELKDGTTLILATGYKPVDDDDYIQDDSVCARINSDSIRKAMQEIFDKKCGCFHVHLHDHSGKPGPSFTDLAGLPGVAKSFSNISGTQLNGYLILSKDSFYTQVWNADKKTFLSPFQISVIGYPLELHFDEILQEESSSIYKRQSFLGRFSAQQLRHARVCIVGYGGGGSHIGQQLAHVGLFNTVIYDGDKIEDSNMNRLIGGWFADIKKALAKTAIARRVIKKILPKANTITIDSRWQADPEWLQGCDVVVGCVDSYAERQQLEAECRRYLIPYIDIGMDVFAAEDGGFEMPGQVILTMPGTPCLHCFGFLTEEKLGKEAALYGAVGGNPQVVWPNGVLASTAVGIIVDLITGWSGKKQPTIYLAYDGRSGLIEQHIRVRFASQECTHYPIELAGPVSFQKI